MGSLQRSCQACIKARRRCNLGTPCCERCSTKHLTCRYTNEPTHATATSLKPFKKPRKFREFQDFYNLSRLVVHGELDTSLQIHVRQVLQRGNYEGSRPPLTQSDPHGVQDLSIVKKPSRRALQIFNPLHLEVVRVLHPESLSKLSSILQSLPTQFAERDNTSFIHSGLYGLSLPPPLKVVKDICYSFHVGGEYLAGNRLNALRVMIKRLLREARRSATFAETLAFAQAITLAQIIRLLECHDQTGPSDDDIEHDNREMWALTHKLWQHAPTQLPSSLSPWQAWLFSENVRRTLMVCNVLLGVHNSLRRGYTIHSLCIEALPFDVRTTLWDADCERAWTASIADAQGPYLVTLSQFTALRRPVDGSSRFEDLLLLAFGT